MEKSHHRIVIVGSGPAGLTAAVYTARAMLKPLVFEGLEPGGQLTTTTDVENFPGFPQGITGPELVRLMREQAERFGTEFVTEPVEEVRLGERPFVVRSYGREVTADVVIISTGASARYLGMPSEDRLRNHGVSACATCDGFFYRDQDVAVIGGGDTAMEEALYLTRFASSVTLIHRRAELRASKIMARRLLEHPQVKVAWNSVVDEYLGDPEGTGLTGLRLRNVVTGDHRDLPVTGAFVAIGHQPNTGLFEGQLEMNEAGYLKVQPGRAATAVPGVFACGDCADPYYRQAITAAGTGCMAAIEAERWLAEQG